MTEKTTWPEAACCAPNYPFGCICPPKERALRAWERGDDSMPPMTERQRAYCLHEIGRVEGYRREDYVEAIAILRIRPSSLGWIMRRTKD